MCTGLEVLAATALAGQVFSSVSGAKAENEANEYNARLQLRNAEIAKTQAADAEARGEISERQHRLQVADLKGRQRSALASSGVVVDEGSALDVIKDTAFFGEQDALTIRHNAALEAYGLRTQAENLRAQSGLIKSRKRNLPLVGATSLLSGLSSSRLFPGLGG